MSYDPPSDTGLVLEELADIKRLLERQVDLQERLVELTANPVRSTTTTITERATVTIPQFWQHVQAVAANHGSVVGQDILLNAEGLSELAQRLGLKGGTGGT